MYIALIKLLDNNITLCTEQGRAVILFVLHRNISAICTEISLQKKKKGIYSNSVCKISFIAMDFAQFHGYWHIALHRQCSLMFILAYLPFPFQILDRPLQLSEKKKTLDIT